MNARDQIIQAIRAYPGVEFQGVEVGFSEDEAGDLADRILAVLDGVPYHVADFRRDGQWTIQHMLSCRPDLLSCPYSTARVTLTVAVGRYHVELDQVNPHKLVLLERMPEPDEDR